MTINPSDIHTDIEKARRGVTTVAEALGIDFDCSLTTVWVVRIDEKERKTFVEMAREATWDRCG